MTKAWSLLVVAALTGCGRSPFLTTATPTNAVPATFGNHHTFRYIGKKQSFKVPRDVSEIKVVAIGGEGGGTAVGHGGRVSAILPVTGGERLAIYVGGNGEFKEGAFNGGGEPGSDGFGGADGYGGGGASDIREGGDALTHRILVAGGGGGQGGLDSSGGQYGPYGVGGQGGNLVGGAGASGSPHYSSSICGRNEAGCGGGGGSQTAGGSGGTGGEFICYGDDGASGILGVGGTGAMAGTTSSGRSYDCAGLGGGGGGGYYGGGGGGGGGGYKYYDGGGGGGGGGSSYVEPSATGVHMWQGWKTNPHYGLIVISW